MSADSQINANKNDYHYKTTPTTTLTQQQLQNQHPNDTQLHNSSNESTINNYYQYFSSSSNNNNNNNCISINNSDSSSYRSSSSSSYSNSKSSICNLSIYPKFINLNMKQDKLIDKCVMSYEEQLQKCISKGNFKLCEEIIESNECNINAMFNRKLPLSIACEYNYIDIVELLLKNGADINQYDFFDQTPLLYAINYADLDIIKMLIWHGAQINKCDSNGTTALHLAICRKNDEICDFLLKCGAYVEANDKQGSTPLSLAISNEYLYMINKLLDFGVDVNSEDKNGDTPLIKAIWSSMSTTIDSSEILNIIKRLVKAGANLNAKNATGRTALYTAIYQNNTEIALYLINNGAKCQLEDSLLGCFSLLHYACFQGNLVLARKLLEKNCDVNTNAEYNETPIYVAATKGYLDIIDVLIEYGADVNIFAGDDTDNKCTPLQAAIYYISEYDLFKQIVDKLIRGGADLSIDEPGPILVLCLQYNKYDFAKYLVSVGADVEQRTIFNQSCFYKAFLSRNMDFMQMCILAGFNLFHDDWVGDYIENPDFIEYPEYYDQTSSALENKTDDEISIFLDEEEYFNRRNNKRNRSRTNSYNSNSHNSHHSLSNIQFKKEVYELLKYNYTNPLSLKDLTRIKIRKCLINVNYKMKYAIEERLPLPKRLKDYLLLKEFLDN